MRISKEQLRQIIKEELAGVLQEAKKTPEWSSDYPARRRRERYGKSAHGHKEDPFTSPIRYVKGKLGMPRDKIEKFKKRHNITTGGEIGDKALSWALYPRARDGDNSKKTMKAMKQDQRRTMDALERLSSVVDKPDPVFTSNEYSDGMVRVSERKWDAKVQYIDTINKIIAGERG